MGKYTRTNWYEQSDTINRVPISAKNLNNIEDGIEEALAISGAAQKAVDDIVNKINFSEFMCKRNASGVVQTVGKTIVNEKQSFDWDETNLTIPSDGSFVNVQHNLDGFSFKLGLAGLQPEIVFYMTTSMSIKSSNNNVVCGTSKLTIYIYGENGERVDISSGSLDSNGSGRVAITDSELVEYIIKNDPEFMIEVGYYYYSTRSSTYTINSEILFSVDEVRVYEAQREEIPKITL